MNASTAILAPDPILLCSFEKAALLLVLREAPECHEKDGLSLRLERAEMHDSMVALTRTDREFITRILKPIADHADYRGVDARNNTAGDVLVALAGRLEARGRG